MCIIYLNFSASISIYSIALCQQYIFYRTALFICIYFCILARGGFCSEASSDDSLLATHVDRLTSILLWKHIYGSILLAWFFKCFLKNYTCSFKLICVYKKLMASNDLYLAVSAIIWVYMKSKNLYWQHSYLWIGPFT